MIIVQAPLRVSILGGGTDLPEWFDNHTGCIVGSTIDKYITVILSKRFDDKIVVGYSKQETVDSIDEIQHDLVREAARYTGMTNGFEVTTLADIPSGGSGLGSSSAILVGLLKAFYEYNNVGVTAGNLAGDAYIIEREILKRHVGMQDAYLSAWGGGNKIDFISGIAFRARVEIPDDNLYLFFTGMTRKSEPILEQQTLLVKEHTKDYEDLASLAANYNPKNLSKDLKRNWEIKKNLSRYISNVGIDTMCKLAKKGGAESWKILGAGGGGFLLVYCKHNNIDKLRDTMKNYKELPFRFTDSGAKVIFNNE